jgi:hypothetical protein
LKFCARMEIKDGNGNKRWKIITYANYNFLQDCHYYKNK